MSRSFNKHPYIEVNASHPCFKGWDQIGGQIRAELENGGSKGSIIVIECYQGVLHEELGPELQNSFPEFRWIDAEEAMLSEEGIEAMIRPDLTDDRLFGYMTRLVMDDFFDRAKIELIRLSIQEDPFRPCIIYGTGASLIPEHYDMLIYVDMARWEIQLRMREHLVDNLGVKNRWEEDWMLFYKQGFFVDWRVCDRLKKQLFEKIDFLLDTNERSNPKMVSYQAVLQGMDQALKQPFSVVPFFDPGPWGGQWMKENCDLDRSRDNYAWCFNCVPEENSLLLKIAGEMIEIPSINLVFRDPAGLLGDPVHARFGDEFPIRFDFLDTMDGGHLSLQVHPLTEYIQEKFGMTYTQDESYYILDAKEDACVYLGLKKDVNPDKMIEDLHQAQKTGTFDVEAHVEKWEARKHDHFLIPAGTVHCSGENCMVLEISATPYIFTFKLWDWGRLGIDGKPRPINIRHGEKVIQWDRTTEWTRKELINRIETVGSGDGWYEERTGLHEREFIETRRHCFTEKVSHQAVNSVQVFCLIEGDEIIVESPDKAFDPFVVHYAETFIIPATLKEYTISPHGTSLGKECCTIKAFVRS